MLRVVNLFDLHLLLNVQRQVALNSCDFSIVVLKLKFGKGLKIRWKGSSSLTLTAQGCPYIGLLSFSSSMID